MEGFLTEILSGGKQSFQVPNTNSCLQSQRKTYHREECTGGLNRQIHGSYKEALLEGSNFVVVESKLNEKEKLWMKRNWKTRCTNIEENNWGVRWYVRDRWFINLGRRLNFHYWSCLEGKQNFIRFKVIRQCSDVKTLGRLEGLHSWGLFLKVSQRYLLEWWASLSTNAKKVVSYGGWIAVEGLPLHLWFMETFHSIGYACERRHSYPVGVH